MTEYEFRAAMAGAEREDRLLWVMAGPASGIAVGLDSGRGVVILHSGQEMPLADAREMKIA